MSKKYGKYAKEFKHELELQAKSYEAYTTTKNSLAKFEAKLKENDEKSKQLRQEKQELRAELDQLRSKEEEYRDAAKDL